MSYDVPQLQSSHAVLQFAYPFAWNADMERDFLASVREEFPNILGRQPVPDGAPPLTPRLVLASTSSQLALSSVQVDFDVRFYDDYVADVPRAMEYVARKVGTVLSALAGLELEPVSMGLITTVHFSGAGADQGPVARLLDRHLSVSVAADDLQDASFRLGLKVRDTYFTTFTLANFESRVIERPVMPGVGFMRVRPGEGKLQDTGLELTVDVNNNLASRVKGRDVVVDASTLGDVVGIAERGVTVAAKRLIESAEISTEELFDE